MEIRISRLGALLALLSASLTHAQSIASPSPSSSSQPAPTSPPSSTFYVPETETQFSLNIANDTTSDSGDVYMYMTSPAYSWVGFGFGSRMEGALMFVVYADGSGKSTSMFQVSSLHVALLSSRKQHPRRSVLTPNTNLPLTDLTLSPRLSLHGPHTEPSFAPATQISLLPGTRIDPDSGMFVLHAVCRYCRAWPGGSLDVTSRTAPMIFAFGPGHAMMSDDKNAGLKRHGRFGRFEMDLVAATGVGGVPEGNQKEMRGVRMLDGDFGRKDHDGKKVAHAVLGCLAIFVVWPVNVAVGAWVRRRRGWVHGVVSAVLVGMLAASYGVGGVVGGQFNRSRTLQTPHQILALISLFPLLLTVLLPLWPLTRLAPTVLPELHVPFASLTLVCLILTGGLGLHLGGQSRPIILVYSAVALGIFLLCLIVQRCARRRRGRGGQREEEEEDEQRLMSSSGGRGMGMGMKMTLKGWKDVGSASASASLRSESAASVDRPGYYAGGRAGSPTNGDANGSGNANGGKVFGGGTMPGPQYLLNMHPGVPVQPGRW
ncbi:uncharacterized protein EI97DRAFT_212487 [Westerdykella ornata]|uniref:DOMON domain-containing protein n=1 Tax=Westerdykella ornata TaxID=318751 RepID=A0A6A6J803_WESOR|nr:uncharacterized protein EI97DRAFT_212487 [Westerdykella ornata]KAF2272367.1 hypothetical protein EI97DRAFT_212487 [Westerdykella ornata]